MRENVNKQTEAAVPAAYRIHFAMLVSCFVLWGLLNNMTDNLVPAFGKIFMMKSVDSSYVQVAFYGAYAVLAVPAALLIRKYSYRTGVLAGLGLYITGALGYIPSAILQNYKLFLVSIFTLASGLSILETTCNPFVISIGSPQTSVRRLNLAQAFNPLGSLLGIMMAKFLILSHLNPAGYEERLDMLPEQLAKVRAGELVWVCVPYVGLIAVAVIIWVFFLKKKSSEKDNSGELHILQSVKKLFESPRYLSGVVTQFFYVGMQIAVWTWTIKYVMVTKHVDEAEGAEVYLAAIIVFIMCRWLCTALMKKIKPVWIMLVMAVIGVIVTLGTIYLPTNISVICLICISGCMSLMFPTIYGIALDGMGEEVKFGAAGLVMAILGGAVITPIMGKTIDMGTFANSLHNFAEEAAAVRSAFWIPVVCFAMIFLYALVFRNYDKKEIFR
ncbi:L-fucose:H+ symporter permease [Clostridium sp. Marseille-P2415]|uniref:L-fucose:H+ symporter permease n=1 Tax=Clostridium sp. Marseille-P2415 TaxID=1805471 RepID=UPI0009884289|nr:L-fucose:H+ symporter permease [Clostridium sp. Marseille-P2415]